MTQSALPLTFAPSPSLELAPGTLPVHKPRLTKEQATARWVKFLARCSDPVRKFAQLLEDHGQMSGVEAQLQTGCPSSKCASVITRWFPIIEPDLDAPFIVERGDCDQYVWTGFGEMS